MARILVIEDDSLLRRNLRRLLELAGHQVLVAADGDDGVRTWRAHGADLILMDIHMPEMDGIEALVQFRKFAPDLPVVMMSGGGSSGRLSILHDAALLGTTASLSKPFTQQELLDAVVRALAGSGSA